MLERTTDEKKERVTELGKKTRKGFRGPRKHKRKPTQKTNLSLLLHRADDCLLTAIATQPIERDFIFVENGHFLDRKTRNRLAVARGAFQAIENASHLMGDDVLLDTKITYNEISDAILDELAKHNIPVREERPFLFNYADLTPYIPRQVKVNIFFNALIELILNEWKINYGRKLFIGFGFEEWGKSPTPENYQTLKELATAGNHELLPTGFNLRTARGLWFASECIIRIRAQWDKLVDQFIFQAYFPERPARKFTNTITKLENLTEHNFLKTDSQKACLNTVVKLARQTDRLKQWRDNDTHQFSETVFGVLENPNTDQTLGSLWNMVIEEHNRVREALVATLGMILLNDHTTDKEILWCSGKWPIPTHYIDFDDEDDRKKHAELLDAVRQTVTSKETLPNSETKITESVDVATSSAIHQMVFKLFRCEDK